MHPTTAWPWLESFFHEKDFFCGWKDSIETGRMKQQKQLPHQRLTSCPPPYSVKWKHFVLPYLLQPSESGLSPVCSAPRSRLNLYYDRFSHTSPPILTENAARMSTDAVNFLFFSGGVPLPGAGRPVGGEGRRSRKGLAKEEFLSLQSALIISLLD